MTEPPKYVSETGYPASVRKLANWAAAQWDRIFEVRYEDTVSPKILLSDEKFTIILPKRGFGANGGVDTTIGGFQCIRATDTSIRIAYAAVNSIIPTGMSVGDFPPYIANIVGTSGVVCLRVDVDGSGISTSASIGLFSSPPADAEPVFYLQIGSYATDDDGNLIVTPGGQGHGVGDQSFNLCGQLGGQPEWGPA